ncbi:FxLD family lanthipeptide (plasmid) [Streptosporangium sp. CA-135522]|uniref:FxLD family lanthipeptide n=1 Tax=Streptosporangium sp. CA-135522 TaxID=3240072 RepID=UPI003D8F5562
MAPTMTFDTAAVGVVDDEEFVLDMCVVEATTPLVTMMCDTGDGCGSTCNGSACSTGSNDPS